MKPKIIEDSGVLRSNKPIKQVSIKSNVDYKIYLIKENEQFECKCTNPPTIVHGPKTIIVKYINGAKECRAYDTGDLDLESTLNGLKLLKKE